MVGKPWASCNWAEFKNVNLHCNNCLKQAKEMDSAADQRFYDGVIDSITLNLRRTREMSSNAARFS